METKAGGGEELNLKNYEVSSCRLQKRAGFYFLRTYVGGTCISYFVSIKKKNEKPAMRYSVFYQKLELQEEPDGGSNADSGSSNPVTKSKPRQWKKGK